MKDDSGQSLFEFLFFLPLFVFFASFISNIGNSINTSINQQKLTRGYFFYLTQNNSFIPARGLLNNLGSLSRVSQFSIFYRVKENDNGKSRPETYEKPNIFIGGSDEESQYLRGDDEDLDSQSDFIRIFTGFGICSNGYSKSSDDGSWSFSFRPSYECVKG